MANAEKVIPLFEEEQDEADEELKAWEEEWEGEIQKAKDLLGEDFFQKRVDEAVDNTLFVHWVTISYQAVPTTSAIGIPEHVEKAIEERFPDFFSHYMRLRREDPNFNDHILDGFMMYAIINGSPPKDEPWGKGVSNAALHDPRQAKVMKYLRRLDKLQKKNKRLFKGKYPTFEQWKNEVLA